MKTSTLFPILIGLAGAHTTFSTVTTDGSTGLIRHSRLSSPTGRPHAPLDFNSTGSPPHLPIPFNVTNPPTGIPPAGVPYVKGFNVRNQGSGPDGFKTQADWETSFNRIKSLPGNFGAVRVYSTTDGAKKHLHDLLPAAQNTGVDLMLGIFLGKHDRLGGRFAQEFSALKEALHEYGTDNVIGISVGNEDLYREDSTADEIAQQIKAVQEWLDLQYPDNCIMVGHTDTYTKLNDTANQEVVDAADFLLANAFPYWENATIDDAPEYFDAAMDVMGNFSARNHGIPIWLGETGWPSSSSHNLPGTPSTQNQQRYWEEIACGRVFDKMHGFYYIDEENAAAVDFGLIDASGNFKIDLKCPGPV